MTEIILTENQFKHILKLNEAVPTMLQKPLQYPLYNQYDTGNTKQNYLNFNFNQEQDKQENPEAKVQRKTQYAPISNYTRNEIAKTENAGGKGMNETLTNQELNGYICTADKSNKNIKTYGFGLKYHPNGKPMQSVKPRYTQQELQQLYLQTLENINKKITDSCINHNIYLTRSQVEAIVSACYNAGNGFWFGSEAKQQKDGMREILKAYGPKSQQAINKLANRGASQHKKQLELALFSK